MGLSSYRDLLRLSHGFEQAKVFFTAIDLDLFSKLQAEGTADGLAAESGVDPRALTLLLNALVAMGLLSKDGDAYRNGALAQEHLVRGEGYRGHIFQHIHHCWDAWSALPEVIQQGHPASAREGRILGREPEWTRAFILGMDDVTRELAPQVVSRLDLKGVRRLLDVGGGPGTYAEAFLEACPTLAEVRLFDLPGAQAVARERLAARGWLDRVTLVEGDLHRDSFGSGLDFVWVSQVFHSLSEDGCRQVIDKAFGALESGGTLAVHEFLLDDDKTGPLGPALFALHMLVMTDGGRAYSGEEIGGWMRRGGFVDVAVKKVSDDTAVVSARKP